MAFLVQSCLKNAGCKCGLLGTVIYDDCSGKTCEAPLTTPDCLTIAQAQRRMLDNGAGYMVIEASSHALSQDRLCQLDFWAAAFTNLTGDHLDYHGNLENYLAAKTRLFSALSPDATAVLNSESPQSAYIAERTPAKIMWYGIDCRRDLTASIKSMDVAGSVFLLHFQGQQVTVKTNLLGRHNISNHLAAAGLCLAAGLDLQKVAEGLSVLRLIPGRLEQIRWPAPASPDASRGGGDGPFAVLVDYAHTDDALKNVLLTLKPLCKGKLRLVFGCGGDRDKTKRPRMAKVAEQLADFIVVTSDNPRTENPNDIIAQIVAGFESRETNDERRATKIIEPDRRKAIELALDSAGNDDIVLIAGKGHENYQIIGRQKHHFSDQEIARKYLETRFGKLSINSPKICT